MSIVLPRKDGTLTPFANSEFIPLYYYIPASVLLNCGRLANTLPRNPYNLFRDVSAVGLVESDFFLLLIIDATAYTIWPHMGIDDYMEIYSGYDPAFIFAHSPAFWAKELEEWGVIPNAEDLIMKCNERFGFVPEHEVWATLHFLVPRIMAKYKMDQVIAIAKEYRCFEDFDFRDSNKKTDFYRKWYHSRTKHPQVSLESFQEDYAERHNGEQWDVPDPNQNVEEDVTSRLLVEEFKASLSDKDMKILQMRLEGHTLEAIAQVLGYKNHSGVQKRIRKIGQAYERFVGEDHGFGGLDE